jgi:hypothetical protein
MKKDVTEKWKEINGKIGISGEAVAILVLADILADLVDAVTVIYNTQIRK